MVFLESYLLLRRTSNKLNLPAAALAFWASIKQPVSRVISWMATWILGTGVDFWIWNLEDCTFLRSFIFLHLIWSSDDPFFFSEQSKWSPERPTCSFNLAPSNLGHKLSCIIIWDWQFLLAFFSLPLLRFFVSDDCVKFNEHQQTSPLCSCLFLSCSFCRSFSYCSCSSKTEGVWLMSIVRLPTTTTTTPFVTLHL